MPNNTFDSRIFAGTMTWGSWGKRFSKTEMAGLIEYCLELGINVFDHADIYGGYTTEADFGAAFVDSRIPRENIQLISKCGIQLDAPKRRNRVKHYDYSKDHIIRSVEQSLKNLNTDYLDMLLLHRPSPLMQPEEIGGAVETLKAQGKVRAFGVSNFLPAQIALLETTVAVEGNQIEFSLTQNAALSDGSLHDCMAKGRTAMSWSPLGVYFKEDNKMTRRIEKHLDPMLEKYDATADQLLLAWILKHPSDVHPVVGTTTKSRLATAMEAVKIDLDMEDWFILLEAAKGAEVA